MRLTVQEAPGLKIEGHSLLSEKSEAPDNEADVNDSGLPPVFDNLTVLAPALPTSRTPKDKEIEDSASCPGAAAGGKAVTTRPGVARLKV